MFIKLEWGFVEAFKKTLVTILKEQHVQELDMKHYDNILTPQCSINLNIMLLCTPLQPQPIIIVIVVVSHCVPMQQNGM